MVSIKGIRLESLNLTRNDASGEVKASGQYSLISSADKVLARQDFNGYNSIAIVPCPDTIKAMNDFIALFKRDLNSVLGLESEG